MPGTSDDAKAAEEEVKTLRVQDIQNIMVIVEIAAQRGAFKPAEFAKIGETIDRLNAILQQSVSSS